MALKDVWRRTTALDRAVVIVVGLACAGSFALFGQADDGGKVEILVDGETRFVTGLEDERTVRVEGPLGETAIGIGGGQVRVLDAPCPRKVCMAMGPISGAGELLACVPNRLLVRIEGAPPASQRDYDLLSR